MFEIIAYNSSGERLISTVPINLVDSIQENKRYAIILENGIDLALILIELYKKRAVAVPIMPSLNQQQVDNIVNHADVDGIILRRHSVITLITRKSSIKSPPEQRFLIYTSGSTGAPKGVIQTQASVEHNANAVAKLHKFSNKRSHATCLPLYHCNALMMSLIGCYLAQCPLILLSSFSPNVYFSIIQKHKVSTASIVPALLPTLFSKGPEWPASLEYLITAAAPLTQKMAQEFFKLYGPKIRQGYGLSEAVNFSFITPLLSTEKFIENYIWQTPPVGLPIKDTQYKINTHDEVLLKGPNLMSGYWLNPDATEETLEDGWLNTGDLGVVRGEFLVLTGRKKEIINRGGETRMPLEIEEMYQPFLSEIETFTVVPVRHKILDNEIGIIFDTSNLVSDINIETTLNALDETIIPAVFAFKKTAKTSTGKPQRLKDGNLLFCYQQNNEALLTCLLNLRINSTFPSDIKLKLERSLQDIIPKKYKLNANTINQNLTISNLIHDFIIDCLAFHEMEFSKSLTFISDITLSNATGTKLHYITNVNESKLNKYLDVIGNNELIMYIQSSNIINKVENPFRYSMPTWISNTLPGELDLQQFWATASPLKFKQYKFLNVILIGKHE